MNHYTAEFKQRAVQLSEEIGSRDAAEQLGISYYTLSDWRRRKNLGSSSDPLPPDTPILNPLPGDDSSELAREVLYLREANALLRRTVDYLLKQQA